MIIKDKLTPHIGDTWAMIIEGIVILVGVIFGIYLVYKILVHFNILG
mgnify:CR=1 FL=1